MVLESMDGTVISQRSMGYAAAGYGQQTRVMDFEAPSATGKFWLKAIATPGQSERRRAHDQPASSGNRGVRAGGTISVLTISIPRLEKPRTLKGLGLAD